jgi:putative membrane protein
MKYSVLAERFFTAEEKKRIEETAAAVEKKTIGEVVVMVSGRSDRYADAEVIGGVLGGGLLALVITELFFHGSLWYFIPISLIGFFPFRAICRRFPSLTISFVGVGRREQAVRHRAVRAFYERGLHRTKHQTGVLFFISLFEHKVWVLADKGIHEKIGQDTLNKFAAKVSAGIRDGRACDMLCEAINEAGELFARHFPVTPDDTNELPDHVITE